MRHDDNDILHRRRISPRQRQLMLAVLIRKHEAFEIAREQVCAEDFGDADKLARLIWQSVLDFYDDHEELPSVDELLAELQNKLEGDPDALDDTEIQQLDVLVATLYGIPIRTLKVRVGLRYLERFLEDCLAARVRNAFDVEAATPAELCEYLETAVERTRQIKTLHDSPLEVPFPDNWHETPPVDKTPTRLEWLDDFLEGGDANGEIITIAAPFGTCKTLLAVQLSAKAARYAAIQHRRSGGPLKLSYHVSWEEPTGMLRVRALSLIGMIPRTHIESGDEEDLSTADSPRDYEREELFRFNNTALQCEFGRWKKAQEWLNFNWRIIDFTGTVAGREHLGYGGIQETAQAIQRDLERQSRARGIKCEAGKIVLDYAGIAVKRFLDERNIEHNKELRHRMGLFPDECKRLLAGRFNCPVYAFAQLSGAAAGLSPGTICKKTDTAENKLLLENADFGITIGNLTPEGNAVAVLQKARRAKGQKHVVVHVNGLMCRVEETRGEYVLYERGRKILSKQDYTRLDVKPRRDEIAPSDGAKRRLTTFAQQTEDMSD